MKNYEIKYYGGSIQIESTSTRAAINTFETQYQDEWYAAGPAPAVITKPTEPEIDLDIVPF